MQVVEELTDREIPYVRGDVGDAEVVRRVIEEHRVRAAVHFAAKSVVAESVRHPEIYFSENVAKGTAFFRALCESGVIRIVVSSTAEVYGNPEKVPIPEEHPFDPSTRMAHPRRCWSRCWGGWRPRFRCAG
ncbi:MAG: GDP-mannose 4,6-dehydratase, partial [Kyrpidia sp.]|nr:GDP-mannose 4,6-dehydratase [Kyrpidia sp.]